MNWFEMILEATKSSIASMLQIALIVIPLLIGTEFLKAYGFLEKLTNFFRPFTKRMYLPGEAAFPVVIGWTIGLQFGAGIVMQVGREGTLTKQELTVTCVFIGIAHSLIEETVIFAGIGGNALILLLARFTAGIIFTYIFLLQLKFTKQFDEKKQDQLKI
ncbi:nucleoside recognition domain-containing protein [Natranaerobius trueperi]|uniref:Nucleoside recognition protein n=1 Tax=Natranaerobius trueperi TaxID=759412 RepID=A0A226BXQ8_9FIRM|nr:nucleoside recognition domain-containing protein [Natranaerobius trueperi]OWZ83562.1 nucleoside recognition protein [Natranaerobius trueperi]